MASLIQRRKRIAFAIFIFVIIPIAVSFLLGELLIRRYSKTGYITPEILGKLSLQYERSVFARNAFPRMEQRVKINDNTYYINEKGYRGRNFETVKPTGKIRIIFYGGSSVFDYAVSEGKDWPHRVENLLKERGFLQVEVINAGTPANKSFESYGRLFAEGHIFSPDYVVLSNEYNDIKYFRLNEPILRQYNWFICEKDPFINYQDSIDKFLSEHSQLYVRLRTRFLSLTYKRNEEGLEPAGEYSETITDLGLYQYKLSLKMFVDLAKNIGAVPVLMIEPRLVDCQNTESQKKRILYASAKLTHEALCHAFEKTDQIVKEVGREKNILVIDAAKGINGKDEFFVDNVHTNEKGSEEVAKVVSNVFASILDNSLLLKK